MKRLNRWLYVALLSVMTVGLGNCAGGRIGLPPLSVLLFNFAPGFGGVHINAPLELTFSSPVDASTVTQDSIRIFTTTTTTQEPDPGAPAVGTFVVTGNVVRFLPKVPQRADLADAGLRIGFTYSVQVPASPNVIEPVRTIEGDPNLVPYTEFFTTKNQTILPAPGDITAEPNLNSLHLFFIDEWTDDASSFGPVPCDRNTLPVADRDSPQVIDTDPDEGESGFGTITGIQPGLGTAFVRLDVITLEFSEPVSPWRIRAQNISIRNTNLGGETFDLFFFFTQDRTASRLQITVFDADSAFDQASVPQGRYVLSLTQFTDLAGNPLVNSGTCLADGTFQLSFSTVSSPALPTDLTLPFQDVDGDGHVDVGGLPTAVNDANTLPEYMAPFLGGFAVDQDDVGVVSPSQVTSSANWGNTAFWTGSEVLYSNGFDPNDPDFAIPDSLRLRGGSVFAATPLISPLAGFATGRSDQAGTSAGTVPSANNEEGKVDFLLEGNAVAILFTGDMTTGPITYHYNQFDLLEDETTGERPLITARDDSIWPLLIFVEDDAMITGDIILDGEDGDLGFNGANDGTGPSRTRGGLGGNGIAGGGDGGNGGSAVYGTDTELINGQTGSVPYNVLGPLDSLSEAVATPANMITGGGGHYDSSQPGDDSGTTIPAYQGGGGGGQGSQGEAGEDLDSLTTPGQTDQGVGGRKIGVAANSAFFDIFGIFGTGGSGGGGGAADDDGDAGGNGTNDVADAFDDGGGGGGAGGGFLGLCCNGKVTLGEIIVDDMGDMDPTNDVNILRAAVIRAVGGRGGSTYADVSGDDPVTPGTDPSNPDISAAIGSGQAGGGGAGGGICIIANEIEFVACEIYVWGKAGGNDPVLEGGGRGGSGEAVRGGAGGGGKVVFMDSNGVEPTELQSNSIQLVPDTNRDMDGDGMADLTPGDPADDAIIRDLNEMTGTIVIGTTVWGDGIGADGLRAIEPGYGVSQIVSEFFDTLSDSVSYDEIRTLSNAPRFPYSVSDPTMRTIRVWLDAARPDMAGLPDLSGEDTTGMLTGQTGASIEAGLHFDQDTGADLSGDPTPQQFDSRFLIAANAPLLGKRFARVRVIFDVSLIGTEAQLLGDFDQTDPSYDPNLVFARPGAGVIAIADDPATTGVIENTLGNIDSAPVGVPAVAEIRVRFTP